MMQKLIIMRQNSRRVFENQRFKFLIDSTQDFIIQVDQDLNVVYASGSGLRKIGVSKSHMVNLKVAQLLGSNDFDHIEIIKKCFNG